jgi:type II secretory pathway pseudopilin PulG
VTWRRRCQGNRGFTFLGVMVVVAVMLVSMTVAVPAWDYVIRNDREEELIFRAREIARAINGFQAQRHTLPTSLDELVRGKFLRKAYSNPMARDGKWRLLHPGDLPAMASLAGGVRTGPVSAVPTPTPARSSGFGSGQVMGPIVGVAPTNQDKALRVFNQQTSYDKWLFRWDQAWYVSSKCIWHCPPSGIAVGPAGQGPQPSGRP